jgi:hypothetical protein
VGHGCPTAGTSQSTPSARCGRSGLQGSTGTCLLESWRRGGGPKWRRNVPGQRTENGRRKKIVDLVVLLSKQQRWDVVLALRFLQEKYEPTYKPRAFTDYLAKSRDVIVAHAASYP